MLRFLSTGAKMSTNEIEQQFLPTVEIKDSLTRDSTQLETTVFDDIYFDDANVSVLSQDLWLRTRDGVYQLKVPLRKQARRLVTKQYREIYDERSIAERLGLNTNVSLTEALEQADINPICELTTQRENWQNGQFNIALDVVTAPDFSYDIGEIEVTGDEKLDADATVAEIQAFATKYGIVVERVLGKVRAYFKQKRPELFALLVERGVF